MDKIQVLVAKDATGKLKAAADQRAQQVFDDAVEMMRVEYESHAVTNEIRGGINAQNISNTLGGGPAPRSLFAFIGFPAESSPLAPIEKALVPSGAGGPGPKKIYKGKTIAGNNPRFTWRIEAPSLKWIHAHTPMPWADGWSWVQKIETYIPHFSKFLPKFMPNASDEVSRSKGGTQLKHELRSAEYIPPEDGYLSTIFQHFIDDIKAYAKGGFKRRP